MTNKFWQEKRVLVAGGAGFIGSFVVEALQARGVPATSISVPRSQDCDLRSLDNCRRVVRDQDLVVHLAARTGGIAYSRAHPGSQYRDCMLMNLNLLEAAREASVGKFVAFGNLLAYPASMTSPLREECIDDGPVAETHLGIGLAKRDMVALARMYSREFGMNVINILSANAYGPNDRFEGPESHVIPATIVKCFRDEDLVVWGDGMPTRDFLYVEDIAEGILLAAERLESPAHVNLASGNEVSIADLVRLIAAQTGFRRRIVFDVAKGAGDPRRVASTDLATRLIGFAPKVSLSDGIGRTIDWYRRSVSETVRK